MDKSRINNDLFDHEMDKKNKQIERIIESNYQLEESVKYMEIKVVDLEEKNKLLEQSLTLKSNENSRIKSKLSEVFFISNLVI